MRHSRQTGSDRRKGFALLITITLLAFLVLLLVSLASLTRVETQVAGNAQTVDRAKANALFALQVAIGELQRSAGPDQRVTARADLGAAANIKQPWLTGVWDATSGTLDPAAPLTWLISGNSEANPLAVTPDTYDPSVAPTAAETLLVGDASVALSSERIKAGLQELTAVGIPGFNGSQVVGHYAYWVGDEGVKARLNLVDPHAGAAADERIYSFVNAQRYGLETLDISPTGGRLGAAFPVNQTQLAGVLSVKQAPLAGQDAGARDSLRTALMHRYHDVTANSRSVLADVTKGGLRKDLTAWLSSTGTLPAGAPADTDPIISSAKGGSDFQMPRWGLLRTWNGLRDDGTVHAPVPQTTSSQGVYPVITFFKLGLGISQGEPLGPPQPLRVHLYPVVVLWNPTNVPIKSDYEVCFSIRQTNPIGNIIFTFTDTGTTRTFETRMARMMDGPANSVPYYRFKIESTLIAPGESRVFTLAENEDGKDYAAGANILTNADNVSPSVIISGATNLTPGERDSQVSWNTSTLGGMDAVLRLPGKPEPVPVGSDYYQILDGALHTIQNAGFATPTMPANAVNPTSNTPLISWTIYARFSSQIWSPRWIAQQNLRAPWNVLLASESNNPGYNSGTGLGWPITFPIAPRASVATTYNGSTPDNLILAEFLPPSLPLFSLAQLQHVNFSMLGSGPTYAVGNSLPDYHVPLDKTAMAQPAPGSLLSITGEIPNAYDLSYLLNESLWDRYFFSTIPDNLTATEAADTGHDLPNARMRFLGDAGATSLVELRGRGAFDTAAAHLWLNGGFNVNSTSEQAWRTLISGLNGLAYDPESAAVVSTTLTYPMSRFVKPIGGANGDWAGYRKLTAAQIDRLAYNIVREVKARGPFRSVADFVNRRLQVSDPTAGEEGGAGFRGTLQAAIERTDYETSAPDGPPQAKINTHATFNTNYVDRTNLRPKPITSVDSAENIMAGGTGTNKTYTARSSFAPGYLTQADVLNVVGASLTARSDTFVIRTYGDVRNPATEEVEGRAWCEAVVQRQPEYVDSTTTKPWEAPAAGSDNSRFGRRFKVVSFRWLSPADI
ncbi:MAG: hypothetical protein WC205_03830 [Opitutaceae bacterium]|jgi:hypothetical protein